MIVCGVGENLLNVSLEEEFCDHFLVPALGGTPRLPLGPYKISASIWSHLLWLSSSGDETTHTVDEGVQAVDYLNLDCTYG